MNYNLKGRRLLIFLELAFQKPENANLSILSDLLNISISTLSKDLKRLLKIGIIEKFYSKTNLKDSRTRYYRITPKGKLLLEILQETILISLKKYDWTNKPKTK